MDEKQTPETTVKVQKIDTIVQDEPTVASNTVISTTVLNNYEDGLVDMRMSPPDMGATMSLSSSQSILTEQIHPQPNSWMESIPTATSMADLTVSATDLPFHSVRTLQRHWNIHVIAQEYPSDLSPGLNSISLHAVHCNFTTFESMADIDPPLHMDQENLKNIRLYIKFVADDQNVGERSYCLQWSHQHVEDVGDHDRFEAIVLYQRRIEAFRALGHIFGIVFELQQQARFSLQPVWTSQAQFESIGAMIDCSRAAVMRLEGVLYMLRNCALMGLNTFQLYTEDTYTIPGEPFFGFYRGVFTQAEIKIIGDSAFDLGIEVFPCIQTLGHLGQILQWPPYAHLKDTSEILLSNHPDTYTFIRKMIQAASTSLCSKRIHIGMDEANGLGEGRYKQLFGTKEGTQIYLEHLKRVAAICHEEGLEPLIWSDMLFTLANNNDPHAYHSDNAVMPDVPLEFPNNIQLVYWDYYHTNPEIYRLKIQQHRALGFDPWVTSSVWTWNRFFAALPFTFDAAKACLSACKQLSVRNVIITLWGDDGNECDTLSALPGLAYFGEQAYSTNYDVDWNTLRRNFAGICGGRLEDWIYASKLDSVPGSLVCHDQLPPNPSKWILWQDSIYSFLESQYKEYDLKVHFTEISKYLISACNAETTYVYPLNYRLKFPALLARVLQLKCNLRAECTKAYRHPTNAPQCIKQLVDTVIQPLLQAVEDLHQFHRDEIWLATFKPFGLEVLQMRYGTLRIRIETLRDRLAKFSEGGSGGEKQRAFPLNDNGMPEFDIDDTLQPFSGHGMGLMLDFTRAYTPSRAMGTG
ncbi:hypothetical protein QVD99_000646 [Batrachochytrium dendrobatidis]|nr:hypothetical protein O5D80_003498 [Batrachochytrium dendrobatidis]KAK5673192.1 hypothetical protein QVD99_000646 [Batrachochytrium dendrobatidis]